jgi:hypothetical protein
MMVIQGASLWHFLIYIYYTPNWFVSSIILFALVLLLQWFQLVWMLHIHTCIESTSTIFTFFTFFIYSPLPISALPLARPDLHSSPSLLRFLFNVQWDFCLVYIYLINKCILLKSISPPSTALGYPFPPILCCSTIFNMFCSVLVLHRCDVFHYSFLSSSITLLYQSHFRYTFCV